MIAWQKLFCICLRIEILYLVCFEFKVHDFEDSFGQFVEFYILKVIHKLNI